MIKRNDITGCTIHFLGLYIEFVFVKRSLKVVAINFGSLRSKTYRLLDLK